MLSGFADGIDPNELIGARDKARNTREPQERDADTHAADQFCVQPLSAHRPRPLAQASKKVELKLTGENTELDKTVLEKIMIPWYWCAMRSTVSSAERAAAGKSDTGTIELGAFHEGGNIIIEVRDDRRPQQEKIRPRPASGGWCPDQELTEEQIDNLIFARLFHGGSNQDVSGRGVAWMWCDVTSMTWAGTCRFLPSRPGQHYLHPPPHAAILEGQLVRVGKETYIISLLPSSRPSHLEGWINKLVAHRGICLRDEWLPVVNRSVRHRARQQSRRRRIAGGRRSRWQRRRSWTTSSQQQVVIKSLESNFGGGGHAGRPFWATARWRSLMH